MKSYHREERRLAHQRAKVRRAARVAANKAGWSGKYRRAVARSARTQA